MGEGWVKGMVEIEWKWVVEIEKPWIDDMERQSVFLWAWCTKGQEKSSALMSSILKPSCHVFIQYKYVIRIPIKIIRYIPISPINKNKNMENSQIFHNEVLQSLVKFGQRWPGQTWVRLRPNVSIFLPRQKFSKNYENLTMHRKYYLNDISQISSHSSKWKYFIWI